MVQIKELIYSFGLQRWEKCLILSFPSGPKIAPNNVVQAVNNSKHGRQHKECICNFFLGAFSGDEAFPVHSELQCSVKPMFIVSLTAMAVM